MALQPDGKILVTGRRDFNFVVARLTADGQLDPTFGVGGIATHDVGPAGSQQYPTALAVQADGKVLVAGWTSAANSVRVARLNTDGSLDSTYGTGGVAVVPVTGGKASAITIQPDGKALVAGYGTYSGYKSEWLLARLTTGGVPDPTFSGDGVSLLEFTGESDHANDVVVLPDGKILVGGAVSVGTNNERTAFARYLPDGRLDPSFGRGGTYSHPLSGGGFNEVYAVAAQPDGRILALTRTFSASRVGRFLPGAGSRPATAAVTVLDDESAAALDNCRVGQPGELPGERRGDRDRVPDRRPEQPAHGEPDQQRHHRGDRPGVRHDTGRASVHDVFSHRGQ